MESSVWIVEEGEYSSYGVEAIFRTEAQAREFCAHRRNARYREWVLDTWSEERSEFEFTFDLAGNVIVEKERAFIADKNPEWSVISNQRFVPAEIRICVRRGPRDVALKAASERFFRLRAVLDEADERVATRLGGEPEHFRVTVALLVAEVLSGLCNAPEPPLSRNGEMTLKALGV